MRISRFLIAASAVAGLLSSAAPAMALDKVVYGTASRPGLANASIYLTEKLGLFEEEGIEIETIQFEGTSVLLPQIANKSVDIGYPIPDFLVISNDTGKDPLPLKFFYNVNRLYNWQIVVPADSPINTLEDLKGKSIGVNSLTTGNVPVTRSILKSVGLDASTDVNLIGTPQGAAAVNALRTGQVDALNFFDVFHAEIELDGFPLKQLTFPERYQHLFGNSFATHVDMFEENPDLLKRFGRAYSKGLVACSANPELCVRTLWEMYPATRPTAGDDAENLANAVTVLQTNLGFKLPAGYPEDPAFGEFGTLGWETLLDILAENGTVTNPDIDLSKLYTNDYVADFGDFDVQAMMERAKAAD